MRGKPVWMLSGVLAIVAVCVAGRLLCETPNFTPIASAALLAGLVFRNRWIALSVPLAAMLITDWVIGFYDVRIMAVTYAALMLPVFLRSFLAGRYMALRVGGCAVFCSTLFFLTTNLAVWAFGGLYAPSWTGLLECYVAALPFAKYTLYGDLTWSYLLLGTYALASRYAPVRGLCPAAV